MIPGTYDSLGETLPLYVSSAREKMAGAILLFYF
jgi:hypothetical protein